MLNQLLFNLLVWIYRRPREIGIMGASPLDIPTRSLIYSAFLALLVSLTVGNYTLHYLYKISISGSPLFDIKGAMQTHHKNIKQFGNDEILGFVSDKFLAKQRLDDVDSNSTLAKELLRCFQDSTGFTPLLNFANCYPGVHIDSARFAQQICGKLKFSKWIVLPILYRQESGADILDSCRINKEYSGNDVRSLTIRRDIILSGMSQIREELSSDWFKPKRLSQALGGEIQWFTFYLAVWGFILVWIRKRWVGIQIQLTETGLLPDWFDTIGLWALDGYKPGVDRVFKRMDEQYPGILVPVRLVKEIHLAKGDDKQAATRNSIRERIAAYRNSVGEGEYEIINYIVWAVPSLGFLGTIIGIIGAMENVANIVRTRGVNDTAEAIKQVSVYLGTAFDTTFVALVLIIFLSFYLASTRRLEAKFFEHLEYQASRFLPFVYKGETEEEK